MKIYFEIFKKQRSFELKKISDSPGKSAEVSIINTMKSEFPELQIENDDDFLILNELRGQIKEEAAKSLLCSYNIGNINNNGKLDLKENLDSFIKDFCLKNKITEIDFFEKSGHNIFIKNSDVDSFCYNYINVYQIICTYNKQKDKYILLNPIEYCIGHEFECEIRTSGKNPSKLYAIDFLTKKLEKYKQGNLYIIKKSELKNSKARNKDELSERIRVKNIPNCFYLDRKCITINSDNYISFKIDAVKQLIPAIAFYIIDTRKNKIKHANSH